MKHRNRLGHFCLTSQTVDHFPQVVEALMARMIVVRCEMRYDVQGFHYIADSLRFQANEPGIIPPQYQIELIDGFFVCVPMMTSRTTPPDSFTQLVEHRPIFYFDELALDKIVVRVTKTMQLASDILDAENARAFAVDYSEAIKGGLTNQEAIVLAEQKMKGRKNG